MQASLLTLVHAFDHAFVHVLVHVFVCATVVATGYVQITLQLD